jgi:Mg2+ and Co2+ transporter CorA
MATSGEPRLTPRVSINPDPESETLNVETKKALPSKTKPILNFTRVTSLVGQQEGIEFWGDLVRKWTKDNVKGFGIEFDSSSSNEDPVIESNGGSSPFHRQTSNSEFSNDVVEELHSIVPLITDVFSSIQTEPEKKMIPTSAVAQALNECGLTLEQEEVQKALVAVGAGDKEEIDFLTFKDMAQKLFLSRLLAPFTLKLTRAGRWGPIMTVDDYNTQNVYRMDVIPTNLNEFFFGKRLQNDVSRWIHAPDFDSAVLLGLALKYSLSPHAVEEVLTQAQTKTEQFDGNHLITVEMLSLTSRSDGSQAVQVSAQHVAVFTVGDDETVITFSQDLKGFAQEWPQEWGGTQFDKSGAKFDKRKSDAGPVQKTSWVEKIQGRLQRPRSRLRSGGVDLLIDNVLQIACADLVEISEAYVKRIDKLEEKLRRQGARVPDKWLNEITVARRQIGVMLRRIRGLQRAIKRIHDDNAEGGKRRGSLEEILDLLDEAGERAKYTNEKATSVIEDYRNVVVVEEKRQKKTRDVRRWNIEEERSVQANNQNNILLMLAIVTCIFTPLTFLCGVYGMNFMELDKSGQYRPAMPELLWKHGYAIFWVFVIIYVICAFIGASCMIWRASVSTAKFAESRSGKLMRPGDESEAHWSGEEDPTQPLLSGKPELAPEDKV